MLTPASEPTDPTRGSVDIGDEAADPLILEPLKSSDMDSVYSGEELEHQISRRFRFLMVFGLTILFRQFQITLVDFVMVVFCFFAMTLFPRFSRGLATGTIALNITSVLVQLVFLIPAVSESVSEPVREYFGLNISYSCIAAMVGSFLPLVVFRKPRSLNPGLYVIRHFMISHSVSVVVCLLLFLGALKPDIYGFIYGSSALALVIWQLVFNRTHTNLSNKSLYFLTLCMLWSCMWQLSFRLWMPPLPEHDWTRRLLADSPEWQQYLGMHERPTGRMNADVVWDLVSLRVLMLVAQRSDGVAAIGPGAEAVARTASSTVFRRLAVGLWTFVAMLELATKKTRHASMLTVVVVLSILGLLHSQSQTSKTRRLRMLVWLMVGYVFFAWLNMSFRMPLFRTATETDDMLLNFVQASGLSEWALIFVSVLGGLTTVLFSLNIQADSQGVADAANRQRAGRFLFEQKVNLFLVKRRESLMLEAMEHKLNRVVAKFGQGSRSAGSAELEAAAASATGGGLKGGLVEDLTLDGHTAWEAEKALSLGKKDLYAATEILSVMRQFGRGSLEAGWVARHIQHVRWRVEMEAEQQTDDVNDEGDAAATSNAEVERRKLLPQSTTDRLSLILRDAGSGTFGWLSRWLDRSMQDEIFIKSPTEPLPLHRHDDSLPVKLLKWLVSAGQEWVLGCTMVAFLISPCVLRVFSIFFAGWALFRSFPIPSKSLNQTLLIFSTVTLVTRLVLQLLALRNLIGNESTGLWMKTVFDVVAQGNPREDTKEVANHVFGFLVADFMVVFMVLLRRAVLVRLGVWDFVRDGQLLDEVNEPVPTGHEATIRRYGSVEDFQFLADRAAAYSVYGIGGGAVIASSLQQQSSTGTAASGTGTGTGTGSVRVFNEEVQELLGHYRELRIQAQTEIDDLVKEKSPGRDLYVLLFMLSLGLWIYVLFFFSLMSNRRAEMASAGADGAGQTSGLKLSVFDEIKEGKLSADMAILLCLHVFYMVSDRLYYSFAVQARIREVQAQKQRQEAAAEGESEREHEGKTLWRRVKAFLQQGEYMRLGVLVLVFMYIQYWMLSERPHPAALVLYYLVFSVYMGVLLVQIRDGLPRSATDTLRPPIKFMHAKQRIRLFLFKIYKSLPFLHELRTLIDWSVMETSLSQAEYFLLEDCHNMLYEVKSKMTGRKQDWPGNRKSVIWDKLCLGWALALLLLGVLLGPLLLFSHLIPTDIPAPLVESNMKLNLVAGFCSNLKQLPQSCDLMTVRLYSSEHQSIKDDDGFSNHQTLLFPEKSDVEVNLPRLVQILDKLPKRSAAAPASATKAGGPEPASSPASVEAVMVKLEVIHEYSRETVQTGGDQKQRMDGRVYHAICAYDKAAVATIDPDCRGTWDSMENFVKFLQDAVAHYHPSVSTATRAGTVVTQAGPAPFTQTIELNDLVPTGWKVQRSGQEIRQSSLHKLEMQVLPGTSGLTVALRELDAKTEDPATVRTIKVRFETKPVQSKSIFLKLGLVGMYASVVFAIGRFFKGVFNGGTFKVIYEEMPDPDDLLDILAGIVIAQHHCDLKREFELFSCLVRVLRSPEALIEMTGDRITQYGLGNKHKPPFPELVRPHAAQSSRGGRFHTP